MKKRIDLCVLLLIICSFGLNAQSAYKRNVRPTKNVIVMIPDGTSTSVISAARWYQFYNDSEKKNLAIDPYICGLVKTYSSNSPIPDSAPAMSAYMTGMPQQAKNISIYPEADPTQDIIAVDPTKALQPLATVFEAAKYKLNKSTGLVVTTDFCHATPAACASHYDQRSSYDVIAPQIAYNNVDVVFGGGASVVTDDMKKYLEKEGVVFLSKDIDKFRAFDGNEKIWALFANRNMQYDLDRNDKKDPSLAEMTKKAIERLSKDDNGFFLMVEGSRVDMAAHANDPIGIISEFLAFDRAVKVAMDFAMTNRETTVIVMPDHGTSGFAFGSRDYKDYTSKGLDSVYMNISQYTKTASGLEGILLKTKPDSLKAEFKKYIGIDLSDQELKLLQQSKNYKESDYMKVSNSVNMLSSIAKIMTSRTHFTFLSGSHTNEDVFLAAYHPEGDLPYGLNTNTDINNYMADVIGLNRPLKNITDEIYVKHAEVFEGMEYTIDKQRKEMIVKKGKNILTIPAYKSVIYLNGKPVKLKSVIIYMDKNETFYVPRSLPQEF